MILIALNYLMFFHLQMLCTDNKYPLEPTTVYATKQEIDQYLYRLGLIRITEIGEAQ
jgi:hypothetical protein